MTTTPAGQGSTDASGRRPQHPVELELVCLSVRQGALRWRASSTVLPAGVHPDEAARQAAKGQGSVAAADVVLHSTSWRADAGGLVLTYVLFPAAAQDSDADAPGVDAALDLHVVAGPGVRHPSPVHVRPGHVAAHAARHLHDLAQRDPHVQRCAQQQPAVWDLLGEHARQVHVGPPSALELLEADGPADLAALAGLAQACAAVDGHAPFDEHTLLSLDGPRQLTHGRVELRDAERLVGCALLTEGARTWTVEAAVLPQLRGQGWGRALLDAARSHVASHGGGVVTAWTHGDAAAAAALGRSWGATTSRRLDVLRRSLHDLPDLPESPTPRDSGFALRHLDPTSQGDRDAWLELSNAAFAGHPDNGGWTRRDLDWRTAAAWTSGRRWPVVTDGQRLLAGVWTKWEPGSATGELYVVAVAPQAQGRGLGRLVVSQALHDLAADGCTQVELYVEADNDAAQCLYRSAGFSPGTQHRCLRAVVPRHTAP